MEPSDDIIRLRVASPDGDQKDLNVHRGVLCKSSKFFQRAMQPEWTNLREKSDLIDLSEDSVQTAGDYIRWLYSDKLSSQLCEGDQKCVVERAERAEKVFVLLAQAYVFGEKILDPTYKDVVMRAVIAAKESYAWNLGPDSVDIVYKGTTPGSPLRRLIADCVAYSAFDDSAKGYGWMDFFDGYPKEALVDAMKATVRVRPRVKYDPSKIELYLEEKNEKEEQ